MIMLQSVRDEIKGENKVRKRILICSLLLMSFVKVSLADPIPIIGSLLQETIFQSNQEVNWLAEQSIFSGKFDSDKDSLELFNVSDCISKVISTLTFFTFESSFVKANDVLTNKSDVLDAGYYVNFEFLENDKIVGIGSYSVPEAINLIMILVAFLLAVKFGPRTCPR